jgi:hypothetical protein
MNDDDTNEYKGDVECHKDDNAGWMGVDVARWR